MSILHDFIEGLSRKHEMQTTPINQSLIQTKKQYYIGTVTEQTKTDILTLKDMGAVASREPIIRRGIWKLNRDIFRDPWNLTNRDGKKLDDNLQKIVDDFNRKTNIRYKLAEAGRGANIYGNGFIELRYDEQNDTPKILETPAPKTPLLNLIVHKPEYIGNIKKKHGDPYTDYYIYSGDGIHELYLHPSRFIHVVYKRLPGYILGISDIYTAYNILQSKINADIHYGEAIEWASTGVYDFNLIGADKTDIKESEQLLSIKKKVYTHNQDTTMQVHNPTIFNPKEFNEHFYINISSTLDMAYYILCGTQPGQLTGSEYGFIDYWNSIDSIRQEVYIPILERVYKLLLEPLGKNMDDYIIDWKPSFADELIEAQVLKMNTESAALAYDRFAIDEDEFRTIMKNGIVDFKGEQSLEKKTGAKDDKPVTESKPVKDVETISHSMLQISEYAKQLNNEVVGKKKIVKKQKNK